MQVISAQQIRSVLDWAGVLDAMHKGHLGSRPIGDSYFIGDAGLGLFSRGVILPGQGAGFKLASIYPANNLAKPPLPTEQAAFLVLDEASKGIAALLDGPEITRWKTAADSALTDAYLHIRPSIREVLLWNHTASRLDAAHAELEARNIAVRIVQDLDAAVARADIISAATSSSTPVIRGACVRPGTHVDLVGGYRPDM